MRAFFYAFFVFYLLGTLGLILFSGFLEYEDVSTQKKYINSIGTKFKTLETLGIHGTSFQDYSENYKKNKIDRYYLAQDPKLGCGNRYTITCDTLNVGAVVQVKKIMSCKNCWLFKEVRMVVKVLNSEKYKFKEIWIEENYVDFSKKNMMLNPMVFEKLNE